MQSAANRAVFILHCGEFVWLMHLQLSMSPCAVAAHTLLHTNLVLVYWGPDCAVRGCSFGSGIRSVQLRFVLYTLGTTWEGSKYAVNGEGAVAAVT